MRTYEEIEPLVLRAISNNDVESLDALAAELDELSSPIAVVLSDRARGWIRFLAGDYSTALALFQKAVPLAMETGNRAMVAALKGNIAAVLSASGDQASALQYHKETLSVFEELGLKPAIAHATINIGIALCYQGDYPGALEHYHRALAISTEIDNKESIASILGNIGIVYFYAANYALALEFYLRGLELCEELDNRIQLANTLGNIGVVYDNMGSSATAMEYFERALTMHQEHNSRNSIAHVLGYMGSAYSRMGDHARALSTYREALTVHQEAGDATNIRRIHRNIIGELLSLGQDDEAFQMISMLDATTEDDPGGRIQIDHFTAQLQERNGDIDSASATLLKALNTAEEFGLKSDAAYMRFLLRELALRRNDLQGYVEHNAEYVRINEEIRGKEATQKLAMMEAERKIEGERREREKERALLYGALPEFVATRMLRGEDVSGDHHDHASVLFLDVAGFTTHSGELDPRTVTELLDRVFHRFDEICEDHGVVKIKTIGDAYLAVAFADAEGVASTEQRAASAAQGAASSEQRAASAALEMLASEFYWPTETADSNSNRVQFRVGLHVGPLVAGVIGKQRLQYDVWGDTVNVASRMESTGEPGRVQVSSQFATALGNGESGMGNASEARVIPSVSEEPHSPFPITYSLRERGAIEVKGKGPMTTYWLEGA